MGIFKYAGDKEGGLVDDEAVAETEIEEVAVEAEEVEAKAEEAPRDVVPTAEQVGINRDRLDLRKKRK